MKHTRQDTFVCFLCDYAGLLFVAFVILIILSLKPFWYPLLSGQGGGAHVTLTATAVAVASTTGTPTIEITPSSNVSLETPQTEPSPSETPLGEASSEETPSADIGDWIIYEDTDLNYSIQYPAAWFATPQDTKSGEGNNRVLFSDAPGNTSLQVRTTQETARIWITSYERGDQPQTQWIVNHFNWIPGDLVPALVDEIPAHATRFSLPDSPGWNNQVIWIDRGIETLVIWIQTRVDTAENENLIQKIIESVQIIQA